MFLDKACIHQTDEVLRERGIREIGAFLAKSNTIMVLYSGTYFKRIWTVYELACFFCTKPSTQCVFLPLFKPPLVCTCSLWVFICYFLRITAKTHWVSSSFVVDLLAIEACYIGISLAADTFWSSSEHLQKVLENFLIDETACAD